MSASSFADVRRVPSALRPVAFAVLSALGTFIGLPAAAQTDTPFKSLGMVIITGGQPTSFPTQIPTTMEGVTQEEITQKNQRH